MEKLKTAGLGVAALLTLGACATPMEPMPPMDADSQAETYELPDEVVTSDDE